MPSLAQVGSPVATAMLQGAEMFRGVADRAADYAIQANAEDAATRGAAITFTRRTDEAGNQVLDLPELRPDDHTPASKAFNRAVLVNFGNALDAEAKSTLGNLALDNPNDPAAFATRADAYIDGVLKGAPEAVRGAASVSLAKMKGEYGLHIEQEVRRDNDAKQIGALYVIQGDLEAEAKKRAASQGANSEDVQVARQVAIDAADAFLTQHGNTMSPELRRHLLETDKRVTEGQISGIMRAEVGNAYAKGGMPAAKAHIESMRATYLGLMKPGTLGYGLAAEQVDKIMTRAESFAAHLQTEVNQQRSDEDRRKSDLERDMIVGYSGAILKIQEAGGPGAAAAITALNRQLLASVAPGSFLMPRVLQLTRGDLSTPTAAEMSAHLVAKVNLTEAITNATTAEELQNGIQTAVDNGMAPAEVARASEALLPARQRRQDAFDKQTAANNVFHSGMSSATLAGVPASEQPGMPAKWDAYVRQNFNDLSTPADRARAFTMVADHGMLGTEIKDWIEKTLTSTDVARNIEFQKLMVIATQDPKRASAIKVEMGPALAARVSARLGAMSQIAEGATPQARQVAVQNIVERDARILLSSPEEQKSILRGGFPEGTVIRTETDKTLPVQIKDSLSGGRWAVTNAIIELAGFGAPGTANVVPGSPKATSDFFGLVPESASALYGPSGFLGWFGKDGTFSSAASYSDTPMISEQARAFYADAVKARMIGGGQSRAVAEKAALLDDMDNWGISYVAMSQNVNEQRLMQRTGIFIKDPLEKRLANLGYDSAESFGWMIGAVQKQMDIQQRDTGADKHVTLPFAVKGEPEVLSIARALKRGAITFRNDLSGGPVGYSIVIQGEYEHDRSSYNPPNVIRLPSPSERSAEELAGRTKVAAFVEEHYATASPVQKSALRTAIYLEQKYPGIGFAMRSAEPAQPEDPTRPSP